MSEPQRAPGGSEEWKLRAEWDKSGMFLFMFNCKQSGCEGVRLLQSGQQLDIQCSFAKATNGGGQMERGSEVTGDEPRRRQR